MSVYLIQGETLTAIADVLRAASGHSDQIQGKNIMFFMGGLLQEYYYATKDFVDIIEGNSYASYLGQLPSGLTKIRDFAFYQYDKIQHIVLPDGVTSIGDYAFYDCINLNVTSLPEGLTSIGDHAFGNCTNLALTSLPEGLTSIGDHAFDSCTLLEEITFKGTPSSIGFLVFNGCTNLTTINVPWSEGEVADAPWGATNATINYTGTGGGVS